MFSILLGIQILVSVAIITLVMLQHGKGADMGAAFGSGASGTVFGSRGSGSFFTRATAILATVFFVNCLLIASPLVRDSGKPAMTLGERLEQQDANPPQELSPADSAAADALEKMETVPEDLPAMVGETLEQESDLPAAHGDEATGDSGAAGDLPE